MQYNPYNYNYYNTQNLQNQLQQNINELQRLQSINQIKNSQGLLVQVSNYQEVVNYPTDASGKPYCFICEPQGIMWIKKFVDGTNRIQTYNFAPANDFNNQDDNPIINNSHNEAIENLQSRMVKLENNLEELISFIKKGVSNESSSDTKTTINK